VETKTDTCTRAYIVSDKNVSERLYTVSQEKKIPDIFDCNLKTNRQILVIFGTKNPDTTSIK